MLDAVAACFPLLFVLLAVATNNACTWTKVMISFFFLAVFKGLFSWITIMPDSSGWQVCRTRLEKNGNHTIQWYAEKHSVWDFLFMDSKSGKSGLCADMMYSGHTYFVALSALGLFELVRSVCSALPVRRRILIEMVVALAAIFQQGAEIYVVLRSRLHYTSDVVMAVLMTLLVYTNSTIASASVWWSRPSDMDPSSEAPVRPLYTNGTIPSVSVWWSRTNGTSRSFESPSVCEGYL